MKAEVTLAARNTFSAANIAGGFAPRMPAVALYPTQDNNNTYPMQQDCNTQGEVTSLYYAYSKDLKNSGNRFAYSTGDAIPLADQGIMQFRGLLGAPVAAGTTVGNIKFTWYIRFHGRTRPGGLGLKQKRESLSCKENMDPQSEMSYADLQAQVATMMGNRNM